MNNVTKAILRSVLAIWLFSSVAALAQSPELGKLFTSPEERAYLDYLRDDFLAKKAEAGFDIDNNVLPEIPVETTTDTSEVVQFHFGGIMTRLDGGRTVWLNGKAIPENELPSMAKLVKADGGTVLRLVTQDKSFLLKPGQTVNVSTGAIWEAFERKPSVETTPTNPSGAATVQLESPVSPTASTPANTVTGSIRSLIGSADEDEQYDDESELTSEEILKLDAEASSADAN